MKSSASPSPVDMRGKAALSHDEILLNYILDFEGRDADPEALIELYDAAVPALDDSVYNMLESLRNSGWSGRDFDEMLLNLSLDERIYRLVPCAMTAARNIPDVCQRARQAYIMLEQLFRPKERQRLSIAIDEAAGDLLMEIGDGRRVEAARLCENDGARDALRRRAARSRAVGAKPQLRAAREITPDVNEAVALVAKELFPDGLRHYNALALRVASRRVRQIAPGADDESVKAALEAKRADLTGLRNDEN